MGWISSNKCCERSITKNVDIHTSDSEILNCWAYSVGRLSQPVAAWQRAAGKWGENEEMESVLYFSPFPIFSFIFSHFLSIYDISCECRIMRKNSLRGSLATGVGLFGGDDHLKWKKETIHFLLDVRMCKADRAKVTFLPFFYELFPKLDLETFLRRNKVLKKIEAVSFFCDIPYFSWRVHFCRPHPTLSCDNYG